MLLLFLQDGAPTVRYGSLSTNELKEVCKERGLSVKGQVRPGRAAVSKAARLAWPGQLLSKATSCC
jgi:hypothetical protein